jgi:hypothetical protein
MRSDNACRRHDHGARSVSAPLGVGGKFGADIDKDIADMGDGSFGI